MKVYRDTTAIILYGNGIVFIDGDFYMITVAGQCLVDRVVHNLVNQVVQSLFADVSDIHGGTFTYSLQTFQYLDVTGRVIVFAVYLFFFTHV